VAITEAKQSWAMPRWFMPIFGGITLLGLIGIGDGSLDGLVDVAAHISGFFCGLLLGLAGGAFQKVFVYLETKRFWVGLLSLALVGGAWAVRVW
jgi:membrane associated rhomboid family serine protease